jgi:uncharacterized protein
MRIAILSDTHSRFEIVEKALNHLSQNNVGVVLHCGDIEDVDTVELFRGFTAHFVFGNCDFDRAGIRRRVDEIGGTLHEPFGSLELAGHKVAWVHGDDKRLFQKLERNGEHEFLFYGHSHVTEKHVAGPTVVVNPGALYRAKRKTFAILDLANGAIEMVVIE